MGRSDSDRIEKRGGYSGSGTQVPPPQKTPSSSVQTKTPSSNGQAKGSQQPGK